ncbi:hypothetical protein FAM18157_02190 [Lacticaseibacillus paracasei]|uniref:Uncharacterized protein n=1 Tax=Lacticaseibacillus paracasei TaxID=1597 RepID=A0A422M0G8_LACPA|nr:hypothetical protein FAM18157_02190 [Lacticaseibacillus paracasei]
MSNETKRDVLKKALDFFVMYGIEQSINYDLKRYQYFSEYDAALPDETEKQKNCPYCHNKCGLKISQDAYSFWYRNKRFKPLFCSNCGRKL